MTRIFSRARPLVRFHISVKIVLPELDKLLSVRNESCTELKTWQTLVTDRPIFHTFFRSNDFIVLFAAAERPNLDNLVE